MIATKPEINLTYSRLSIARYDPVGSAWLDHTSAGGPHQAKSQRAWSYSLCEGAVEGKAICMRLSQGKEWTIGSSVEKFYRACPLAAT